MNAGLRIALQVPFYAAFVAFIGYFSTSPAFEPIAPGHALLRISLNHAGQRKSACHVRTPEELAKLPPNMRAAEDCPRERAPVRVKVELDGATIADIVAVPAGLSRDGASVAYRRLAVPAGEHRLRIALADDAAGTFDRVREETVTLEAGRVLVVDFAPAKGGILLR
jgi:hypothetical protein